MNLEKTLRFISLLCAAVVFGLTVTHVLEIPGKRTLDGAGWLTVQHTFYGGFAVVGGLAEVLGLLATAALIFLVRERWSNLVASLCFLGTLLAYWFGNRPVNAKVSSWTPATLPANWTAYRDLWDYAHAASAALATIALVFLLVAVLRETSRTKP